MGHVAHVVYLHGFASSPASSKAQRFGQELARRGVGFECPDLNEPDFGTLTVTRMLRRVRQAIAGAPARPIALVGSSLGAFVALHAATADVARLILLAPAVDFGGGRLGALGAHRIAEWKRAGRVAVFHHAWARDAEIGFTLYEDAARYDAFGLRVTHPTLVFQGRRDDVVDPASVARWAGERPQVELRMLDDGHQLTASMDAIWEESRRFLGLER